MPPFPMSRSKRYRPSMVRSTGKLSDSSLPSLEHAAAEAYGVWVQKSMYGRKYMGIERSSFLIGRDGRIAKIFQKVKPEGHAEEVLAALGEHK